MKKFIATILAIVYFAASTGATVNIHYCMGKVQSMDFGHSLGNKQQCSKCGMSNKKGCCEQKHQIVKVEKKYTVPSTNIAVKKFNNLSAPFYTVDRVTISTIETTDYPFANSPPDKGQVPLFIRHCVLLIWFLSKGYILTCLQVIIWLYVL